jgi:acetolactate synthase-1/2/3 large subunit
VKLAEYVAQFLRDHGGTVVFTVPGGGAMHLNDAFGHTQGLDCVYNLHEQASAVAAEAFARTAGGTGVALVTSGPGSTNAITGLLGAWLDSTPVVFLSGQVKTSDLRPTPELRQVGAQEVDICSLVDPISKYAVTIRDPFQARIHLETAFHLVHSGRPGPVWIDIPLDIQAADIDPKALASAGDSWTDLEPAEHSVLHGSELSSRVAQVVQILRAAQRPLVLAGNGIRIAGAMRGFTELVHRAGVPVLTTRLGVDLLPGDDPLYFGTPGMLASRAANFILQNCDALLAIGTRLDQNLVAYDPHRVARGATKVMVNIDASELDRLSSVIDLPVCADAAEFVAELAAQLDTVRPDVDEWIDRCGSWKARYPFVTPESTRKADAAGLLSVYRFADALSDAASEGDVLLPGSSGTACEIVLTALRVKPGQRVFHNKGTGAMGFGPPAALGACLASGGTRVICVDGDGGFQFNAQELETIRRLALPIKFFVVANEGYACIRQSQTHHFGRLSGADASSGLTLPDITTLAQAYGVATDRISSKDGLADAIRRVLSTDGPCVCEVVVAADEERMPRVQSMVRDDGSVVSKPLEDMWPFLNRDEFLSNMIVPPLREP